MLFLLSLWMITISQSRMLKTDGTGSNGANASRGIAFKQRGFHLRSRKEVIVLPSWQQARSLPKKNNFEKVGHRSRRRGPLLSEARVEPNGFCSLFRNESHCLGGETFVSLNRCKLNRAADSHSIPVTTINQIRNMEEILRITPYDKPVTVCF
jgi:hypothetical protein